MPLSEIFQEYHVVISFIGGGNHSTWRKPLTCQKSHNIMLYRVHLAWAAFELTLVVIGTDCIGSCKSIRSQPRRPRYCFIKILIRLTLFHFHLLYHVLLSLLCWLNNKCNINLFHFHLLYHVACFTDSLVLIKQQN